MRQVLLYDTTLRDGMQGQGMTLSAQEKERVVRKLDELGVHFIEAGFPGFTVDTWQGHRTGKQRVRVDAFAEI